MNSKLLEEGFKRIWEEDRGSQVNFLTTIATRVRGMKPDILFDNCVFIPNNEYMIKFFGKEIRDADFDCYYSGKCKWNNYLIFPIYDIVDNIVGLAGFQPVNKARNRDGDYEAEAYRVSSSRVLDKRYHMFTLKGILKKGIKDGYIVLTDGNFDTISLVENGINACALLSSYLSEEQIAILKLIDKVYLAVDNDSAGLKLARWFKQAIPSGRLIKFNKFKDIDDLLKSEYRDTFLAEFHENLQCEIPMDIVIRKENRHHLG